MSAWVEAALWGLAGAFIWAGPEWLACAFAGKGSALRCSIELAVRLAAGSLAAAAFTGWATEFLRQEDHAQAVAAVIGMVANRASSSFVEDMAARISRFTQGAPKHEP